MKARLIRIGNSRGIRIPKTLIEQAGLSEDLEIEVESGRLIIRPAYRPRRDWEEAFRLMAERGDDDLLDAPTPTDWDEEEWEW